MSQTERGTSRKRILAVDDTAIILTRISDILRNDFDVITVNSGAVKAGGMGRLPGLHLVCPAPLP